MKKIAFIVVLILAVAATALTAGFTNSLQIHKAIGQAGLAAEAGDGNYDYNYSVAKGTHAHVYRYAVHISSGQIWNPTTATWSATTAWADGMKEIAYVDRMAGYPDDLGFGSAKGENIMLLYYDVTTGPEVEPLKRVQITWDKHSNTIERNSLKELN